MAEEKKGVQDAAKLDLDDLNAAVGGTLGNAHTSDTKDLASGALNAVKGNASALKGASEVAKSIYNGHKSPAGD